MLKASYNGTSVAGMIGLFLAVILINLAIWAAMILGVLLMVKAIFF